MTDSRELLAIFDNGIRPFRGIIAKIAGPQDAEDAFQDACLSAWRGLPSFRGDCPIHRWFWRIVWTSARQIVRHRKGVVHGEMDSLPSSVNIERQVLGTEVIRQVATRETRLWMAGHSLSPRDKVRSCRERQAIREWVEGRA